MYGQAAYCIQEKGENSFHPDRTSHPKGALINTIYMISKGVRITRNMDIFWTLRNHLSPFDPSFLPHHPSIKPFLITIIAQSHILFGRLCSFPKPGLFKIQQRCNPLQTKVTFSLSANKTQSLSICKGNNRKFGVEREKSIYETSW